MVKFGNSIYWKVFKVSIDGNEQQIAEAIDSKINEIKEKELSYVLAKLFETKELKAPQGGISQLSHGQVSRIDLAEQAFIMALTHFINGEIWK